MIRYLIAKELTYNLLTFRFLAGLVFVLLVFFASSVIFCSKFENELSEYQKAQQLYREGLESGRTGLANLFAETIPLTKEPRITSLFATGREERYPETIVVSAGSPQRGSLFAGMRLDTQRRNYKLERYTEFDWVFLIGVILSFLAIVFSFDGVSRDREDGTLKLQLSNSLPRSHLLFAKYLAIVVLLLIPIALGLFVNMAIVRLLLGQDILLSFPLQVIMVSAISVLYLSLFVWPGLWISSSVSKSSTSLAILLLLWTFFVILAPYLGGMIAQQLYPVASKELHEKQFKAVVDEMFSLAPKEYLDFYRGKESNEGWKAIGKYFDVADATMEKFVLNRFTELSSQAMMAERFNLLSPFSSFRHGMEQASNTGLVYHKEFFLSAVRYRHEIKDFIRKQDLLDPQSKHRVYYIQRMQSISDKSIDPQNVPRFTSPHMDISINLQNALPSVLVLLLFNSVCFSLATLAFSRFDVR